MTDSKDYTVYIRNFDSKRVTHDLLLELFTQAGPVQNLTLKEEFAFLEFEDIESVMYACNLLNDTCLFGIPLQVKPRNGSVWEKEEFFKFPNQNNYENHYNDNRLSNNDYNNLGYVQNDRYSVNNYNDANYRRHNRSLNNNYIESDYRQHNRSFPNSFHESDYRYVAADPTRQNRQHKIYTNRRYDNHSTQWNANRTTINKSFGNYRDRPY